LHAARAEPCADDRAALLEAARLDPDPLSRSVAVQALGALGGPEVAAGLVDLWPASDPATRQGIADAWAAKATYSAGGEARLLATLETQTGLVAIVAARGLVQNDSQYRAQALGALLRASRVGASDERRLAIGFLPLVDEGMAALVEAQASDDPSVSVAAAERLLAVAQKAAAAKARLRGLAQNSSLPVRRQAQLALARAGDRSVAPALEKSLSSSDPDERRHAALALLALGDYPKAATELADDVASVRTQVACAVLAER
jgi:HEAT repeat protein